MTTPPTAVSGSMVTVEGCSSISDANGNLLFYTDGSTIWDQTHAVMPNGINLGGNTSTTQSAIIVKQPGNSNIYYVFSLGAYGQGSLYYSIVDMNLAAGLGSVTVASVLLSFPNSEKLTYVKHCNNTDYWILSVPTVPYPSNQTLNAYLLTAAGLNTVPVVSTLLGLPGGFTVGNMKTSPDGKKIAFAQGLAYSFGFCDFDRSTGIASNVIGLTPAAAYLDAYGVEFSPDGTKLYGTTWSGTVLNQWNLCAGSAAAIIASHISMQLPDGVAGMQLSTDGKIYVAKNNQNVLGVINNPNNLGAACNYTAASSFTLTGMCNLDLPNFSSSDFSQPPGYTYTVGTLNSCSNASFNATVPQIYQANLCQGTVSAGPPPILWDFGDPASGAANTATSPVVSHNFIIPGTHTVNLVAYNYNVCTGANDTVTQLVTIPFCVSVNSQSISCSSVGSATVIPQNGIGPFNFTWMPTGQTSSVAVGLSPGTYTIVAFDGGSGMTYTTTTSFVSPMPYTGTVISSPYQPCASVNTGTANMIISGGSGNETYAWTGPLGAQTGSLATALGVGNYTVIVTDTLTSCSLTRTFTIGPPPAALGVNVSANPQPACAGSTASLLAIGYGGTPIPPSTYNYSWTSGPPTGSYNTIPAIAGNFIYTVTITDDNNCALSTTLMLNVLPSPVITLSSVSVCPQQAGTLTASGANTYTWSNGTNLASLVDAPAVTTVYSVTGSAQGCATSATASIVLMPAPVPTVGSNGAICPTTTLNLYASGGSSYAWTGPSGFTSFLQNPQVNNVTTANDGIYNVIITGANSCTAASVVNATVNATPALAPSNAIVCGTQTTNLLANAPTATSYTWTGPGNFSSSLASPAISVLGIYNLTVMSVEGCTNSTQLNATAGSVPVGSFSSNSPKCQGDTINLNSSSNSPNILYSWSGPNNFTSTLPDPAISNAGLQADGIYTLVLANGPCTISITNFVTIYPLPVPIIINNGVVCETRSLALAVNTTFDNYLWSGPANFSGSNQGFVMNNAQTLNSGVYTVVVTDTNSCRGQADYSVNIEPNPLLEVTNVQVCMGQPTVVSASGAATYLWTGPGGFTAYTQQVVVPSPTTTTPVVYSVIGTGLNTCTGMTTVEVSARTLPIAIASITPRGCVNSPVYFSGTGGTTYLWSGPHNFLYTQKDFTATAVNENMSGTYTLTVTDGWGCKGYDEKNIIIDPAPQGDLWRDNAQNCVPFCSVFKFVPNGRPVIESKWQINGQTFTNEAFNYCFSSAGNYTINGSFTDDRSCKSSLAFVINAYPLPKADYTYFPQLAVENEEIKFESTSGSPEVKDWSWYFADNKAYPVNSPNPSYVFENGGTYPVALVIKNKWGCADTVVKSIVVDEDFYLFVPDAFTPNEDGLNETFKAVTRGVKSYSLMVYDRWGEKLFESNALNAGWDGSFKGTYCQEGVYVWKISATSVRGKEKRMAGSVLLYR